MSAPTLIYGYGNIGRQDDGLGVILAQQIEAMQIPNIDIDMNYQLNVEDALKISEYKRVIFIDASMQTEGAYILERITAKPAIEFSTHAMSPFAILAFAEQIYDQRPDAYMLHIKATEWEFGLPLSSDASNNLELAKEYLLEFLNSSL